MQTRLKSGGQTPQSRKRCGMSTPPQSKLHGKAAAASLCLVHSDCDGLVSSLLPAFQAVFFIHFGTVEIAVQFLFGHVVGDFDRNINQLHLHLLQLIF